MAAADSKENIKWVMGIIASILIAFFTFSINNWATENREVIKKINQISESSIEFRTRLAVVEREIEKDRKAILDLQLAQQRVEYFMQLSQQRKEDMARLDQKTK